MELVKKNIFLVLSIALMLCFFYFYASMLKASIGSVSIILHNKYMISEFELSLISSVFYLVAGLLKIPMGILVDKYGAKKILLTVIVFTSIGALIFSRSTTFSGFLIARIFMSISYASALLCAVKVISQYFQPRMYPLLIGIILSLGYLGAAFAGGPLSVITTKYGITNTYFVLAIIGMIILIMLAMQMEKTQVKKDTKSLKEFTISSLAIIKNKQVLYITLYCGLIVAGPVCVADLWGKLYFVNIYGMAKSQAGYISTSLIYLGIAVGSLIWGIMHSIFMFDKRTLITVSMLMFLSLIGFFILPIYSPILAGVIAFTIGALAAVKVVCYELGKRFVNYDNLALVVALMAMSVTFGSFVVQVLVGALEKLAENFSSGHFTSYTFAISILPIIAVMTALLASKIISLKTK